MNYNDVKRLEQERPKGEGASISENEWEYVTAQLLRLGEELDVWLESQITLDDAYPEDSCGIYNTGHCFANDVFCCLAYDWNEGESGPRDVNFYHFTSGCDISWYKYYTRGLYAHSNKTIDIIDSATLTDIIDECIASLSTTPFNQWQHI